MYLQPVDHPAPAFTSELHLRSMDATVCRLELQTDVGMQPAAATAPGAPGRVTDTAARRKTPQFALPLDVPGLMRGAPLGELLRGGCSVLAPLTRGTTAREAAGLWRRSRPLTPLEHPEQEGSELPLDYFVSHCWQDGASNKRITLMFFFRRLDLARNVLVAGVAATLYLGWAHRPEHAQLLMIGCVAVQALTLFGWMPSLDWLAPSWWQWRGPWRASWHSVAPDAGGSQQEHQPDGCSSQRERKTVWVDRLCIHQHNQLLQTQGIASVGAVLCQSRQLLVLWSPRFFERLWCTYELAVFLAMRSGRDEHQLQLVPVLVGLLWCCATFAASLFFVVTTSVASQLPAQTRLIYFYAELAVVLVLFRICRMITLDLAKQRSDADRFSIRNTALSHENDREILYNTVSRLFANRFKRGPDSELAEMPVQLGPEAMHAINQMPVIPCALSSLQTPARREPKICRQPDPQPQPGFLAWDEAFDAIVQARLARWVDVGRFLGWETQAPVLAMMFCTVWIFTVASLLESEVSFRTRLELGVWTLVTRMVCGTCVTVTGFAQLGFVAQTMTAQHCGKSMMWDVLGSTIVLALSIGPLWVCLLAPVALFHTEDKYSEGVHPAIQPYELQQGWPEAAVRVIMLGVGAGYSIALTRMTDMQPAGRWCRAPRTGFVPAK